MNFASEMEVFGLVGGVGVYMVVFKAHKYGLDRLAKPSQEE